MTNSVRHAEAPAGASLLVTAELTDRVLRLEVADAGHDRRFARRRPDLQAGGGFGLHLVERLSLRWGVAEADGTVVVVRDRAQLTGGGMVGRGDRSDRVDIAPRTIGLRARGSPERAAGRLLRSPDPRSSAPTMSSSASPPPPNEPLLRMDVATADGTARVRLAGDLDLSTVPALRTRGRGAARGRQCADRARPRRARLHRLHRSAADPRAATATPRRTASRSRSCPGATRCSACSTSPGPRTSSRSSRADAVRWRVPGPPAGSPLFLRLARGTPQRKNERVPR